MHFFALQFHSELNTEIIYNNENNNHDNLVNVIPLVYFHLALELILIPNKQTTKQMKLEEETNEGKIDREKRTTNGMKTTGKMSQS